MGGASNVLARGCEYKASRAAVERFQQERAGLGGQAPADRRGAVVIRIHVERSAGVLPARFVLLRFAIHATPAANDALDVLRRAGAADREQPRLDVWRRHAGEGADLGVRQLAAGERLGQPRQRGQGPGHADLLAGRAEIEADAPGEPLGTGPKAGVPAAAGIEVPDQIEQACGGRIEVGRELGDRVANALERGD